ncbi:MAG: response regulator [Rhodobacteraceae bacterium]|nr:response regulator [Paracoccaceae bacterium]
MMRFLPFLDLRKSLSMAFALGLGGIGLTVLALMLPDQGVRTHTALSIGVSLGLLALLLGAAGTLHRYHLRQERRIIDALLGNSAQPGFLAQGSDHAVTWANHTGADILAPHDYALDVWLSGVKASPSRYIARMHDQAQSQGVARDELFVEGTTWLAEVTVTPGNAFLWVLHPQNLPQDRGLQELEWAHFDAEGRITRISAALQAALGTASLKRLDQLLPGSAPAPGQSAPVSLPADAGRRIAWRQGGADEAGIVLLLPPPDLPAIGDIDQALNALPVAIAHIAPDGRIALANQAARRLLQITTRDDVRLCDRLEGLGRPLVEWLEDVRSGHLAHSTEVMRLARRGEEAYIQVSLRKLPGGPEGYTLAVMHDATELKSLEAKFTQSQKMQAIGQLAGGVAHDFNNLLTAISGHCELIVMRHDSNDVDYPDLMQIQQNTNRAAALVRQLLAFSRKQTLQIETLDLHATLADLVHLLNRLLGEKITLSLRYAEPPLAIRSDRRQLEQILINLVVNARDAMPLGGEVVIATELRNLPDGLARDQVRLPAGEYAVIEVRDQGLGIPRTNLPKLFEPFFTTKRQGEGTGLGLSTAYGLVKQMGGFIFIDSEEGLGTTVSLYFKPQDTRLSSHAAGQARAAVAAMPTKPRSLVLLVEDEAPVRSFAARALQLQGHQVLEADSGEAALDILADGSVRPDLFVTDVIMPGLDGPGWVSRIRTQHPDTPVVFMSGYAEDNRSAARDRVTHATFLAKPFSLKELTAIVDAQLRDRAVLCD